MAEEDEQNEPLSKKQRGRGTREGGGGARCAPPRTAGGLADHQHAGYLDFCASLGVSSNRRP